MHSITQKLHEWDASPNVYHDAMKAVSGNLSKEQSHSRILRPGKYPETKEYSLVGRMLITTKINILWRR